jgi:SH3 domain-containing YSC84-like protein 1
MRVLAGTIAAVLSIATVTADISSKLTNRINEAATVLNEIHAAPDRDIPQQLWDTAQCVIVIPSLKKAAFVVGGEYGKGLMSCRYAEGWSAPIFMEIEKGSWGLQIGAQSIDLVLIVNSRKGMEKMLGNKVSLGVEASVAAGPVGRDARAATDAQMKAEVLSYSRTQGLFAGINVSGGVLKSDTDYNTDLYGATSPRDVVMNGTVPAPVATEPFMKALRRDK